MPKTHSDTYYITTAIDYPNGPPHLGHAYEKILADLYARWARFRGIRVFFLTGTDENGQKLQKSAQEKGFTETRAFVDENAGHFEDFCHNIELSHDDFIRTTQPRHTKTVHKFWQELSQHGDIYRGTYQGWYCYDCEQFYPQNQLTEEHLCPYHLTPLTFLEEAGYFFKTSRYRQALIHHITTHEEFIFPSRAREEILSRLRGEQLQDLPISRKSRGWGIAVPASDKNAHHNEDFVIYTWFDALINYYSVIQNGDLAADAWPCDVHVIGKDITWFHSVIWPAMLLSYGLPLPRTLYVHGMILDGEGRKMSKSVGNVIDPGDILHHFPLDTLRYTFLRGVVSGRDGKLSWITLQTKHNQELANELGNLVSRLIKLSLKKLPHSLSPPPEQKNLLSLRPPEELTEHINTLMEGFQHHKALDVIFAEISALNQALNTHRPWSLNDAAACHQLLYPLLYQLYVLTILLHPFLPTSTLTILSYLNPYISGAPLTTPLSLPAAWNLPTFHLKEPQALFAKITLPSELL